MADLHRCAWVKNERDIFYHDTKWGFPIHEDATLFSMLVLEGMQAGLSWSTILTKWTDFFEAFDQFDPKIIQFYNDEKIESLMQNEKIIRNRLKIKAAISNAQQFLTIQKEYGSFNDFLWRYVDFQPIQNNFEQMSQIPASTPLSEQISKDLKKRGFKFIGPTIIYAYMQSIGMVNDHLISCFRHQECQIKTK